MTNMHCAYVPIFKRRSKTDTPLHIISYISKFSVIILAALLLIAFSAHNVYAGFGDFSDYSQEEEPTQFITFVNLNLRSGPSTDYPRLALLPSGTVLTVTEFNPDGFSSVVVHGIEGFVSSEFIQVFTQPENGTSQPSLSGASLGDINGDIELLSWAEVQRIMPVGTHIHVYDIGTGLTYTVRNFSNGNHADVETLDQHGTDTMRATSGGSFSWDVRPVLVTINGRTIAAAIHTMPHAGYTISGNGMNGHVCLHFLGSRSHNGNRQWEAQMQAAVMQAFNSR